MIDKLELFLALAREKHFGHAAEKSGVTQQTLSAAVKQLEGRFGVMLVHRGSRFRGFTPEGDRVLEWARRIVGDARAMQQDLSAMRGHLEGHLRLGAIPTVLPMVARLTTPYREKYPGVRFSVHSATSDDLLQLLEQADLDAGLTYLDNEKLGRVTTVPLYKERYCLLTAAEGPLGERESVSWAEVGQVKLCLLTPDMQNRRIIDKLIREAGAEPAPSLESNSMVVLLTHVRTAKWASVMPAVLADTLGVTARVRAIPIVEPEVAHTIGLVVPHTDPPMPMVQALIAEARGLALEEGQGALPPAPPLRTSP
jgi:DNA-binding transcriptional LysR family regulator